MEAFESRLQSFTKARRVKQSTTRRTVSLKWPHPAHFVATPDTLTEAGFFFNPSWDARDSVECFCCGKCLAGWEENDDPFALHWDRCRDTCPWAVVRCGLSDDVDRKGNFVFKDSSRQPDGKPMEKARLATFRLDNPWPHDRVKGHGANSTKMAKAGFAFTPQIPGDDTGTCLYCRVSLNGWDEDDDPLEEHHKRVKKSNLCCPFFPESSGPKARSRTTSLRSAARPKSRAGSRQPQPAASETSTSRSDDDSQPAPPRPAQRSRTRSMASASKERDAADVLRRSTRSSRAKPALEVEEDASGTELSKSTTSRSKSSGKRKGKGPIEVIEEADEDDIARSVPPPTRRVKGKENVAHDAKVRRPTRHTKTFRANDTEEEGHQPKRRPPKKGRIALDEREESSPDVGSESDVRPVGKRQNRGVKRVSSREVSSEEIKPEKLQAPMKKAQGKVVIEVFEFEDDRIDETEGQSRPAKKTLPKVPAKPRAKPRAIVDSDEGSDNEPEQIEQTEKSLPSFNHGKDKAQSRSVAISESAEIAASWSSEEAVIPFPAVHSSRSPECPELATLQREENPVTPPPASSSLLSVSSTTSTTKVEGHTDTETLVESLPVRANRAQLTEEERLMTVEQWIRQEIEVQYERLKRDGETKIRLFRERAEEVRRQVEAL